MESESAQLGELSKVEQWKKIPTFLRFSRCTRCCQTRPKPLESDFPDVCYIGLSDMHVMGNKVFDILQIANTYPSVSRCLDGM